MKPLNQKCICDYGCGEPAKFQFKNGKYCCEKNWRNCIVAKEKLSKSMKGKKHKSPPKAKYIENSNYICNYGCKGKAHYYFKNVNKWCCENHFEKCPESKRKNSERQIGRSQPKTIYVQDSKNICSFGCGRIAKYLLKNKNWACEENWASCPVIKKRFSKSQIGKISYTKGEIGIYSEKTLIQMSETKKYSFEEWKEKHPFLFKVEELREDPITKKIQAHCKNHNCPNSKEKNGWFFPDMTQLSERGRCLKNKNDGSGSYFYCSQFCKNSCVLFNRSLNEIMKLIEINNGDLSDNLNYSSDSELGIWRQEVFKRNIEEYGKLTCEYCGNNTENELCSHHIYPIKTHPEQILDPNNGIIFCKFGKGNNCHLKIGHPKGTKCSTGSLAHKWCFEIYDKNILKLGKDPKVLF